MAIIGAGPRGMYVLSEFLKDQEVRFVAACDCFAERRARAKELIDGHYGNSECAAYLFTKRCWRGAISTPS